MSERMTNRWKGSTSTQVINAMGSFHSLTKTSDGLILRFDYSYPVVTLPQKENGFQVKASTQPNSLAPRPASEYHSNEQRDSVIKRMDFYFDKTEHLQYVVATGFPDSVYYVKRKKLFACLAYILQKDNGQGHAKNNYNITLLFSHEPGIRPIAKKNFRLPLCSIQQNNI